MRAGKHNIILKDILCYEFPSCNSVEVPLPWYTFKLVDFIILKINFYVIVQSRHLMPPLFLLTTYISTVVITVLTKLSIHNSKVNTSSILSRYSTQYEFFCSYSTHDVINRISIIN